MIWLAISLQKDVKSGGGCWMFVVVPPQTAHSTIHSHTQKRESECFPKFQYCLSLYKTQPS